MVNGKSPFSLNYYRKRAQRKTHQGFLLEKLKRNCLPSGQLNNRRF